MLSLIMTLMPLALKIGTTYFEYYITGTKTKADLEAALSAYAQAKGKGNQSADDRKSAQDQEVALQEMKDKANKPS